jgi:hypothetical protein
LGRREIQACSLQALRLWVRYFFTYSYVGSDMVLQLSADLV